MKFKGLASLLVGSSLILGCDAPGDLLLDEVEIKGPVKLKLIREVKSGEEDGSRLEVYDEKEKLRATFKSSRLSDGTKISHDEKNYIIKDGVGYYIYEK